MKAEISNLGLAIDTRNSGVLLQQGRVITDADWNALCTVLSARLAELTATTLDDGIPRQGGLLTNFRRAGAQWRADFRDGGGTLAAEGQIGTVKPFNPEKEFTWINQRDLPSLFEGREEKPDFLYVDVWDQVVTAFDDASLLDVALHGADTCFVTRRVAQIKAADKEMLEETDCGLRLDAGAAPRIGTGLVDAELREGTAATDPCDPCAETVDLETSITDHLWRLEVHAVHHDDNGRAEEVILKWSTDNGAVQWKRPAGFDHTTLDAGYAYEFFNDDKELQLGVPPLGYGTDPDRGDLRHEDLADAHARYDRIRQWDGWCRIDLESGKVVEGWDRGQKLSSSAPAGHGRATYDDGIATLELERLTVTVDIGGLDTDERPRRVLAGDYWLALSRNRAPEGSKIRMLSAKPIGIQHGYCLLGEPNDSLDGVTGVTPQDKRRLSHPALDCLRAEDVSYDNSDCAWARSRKATSVQEALDAFCRRLQHPYIVLRPSYGTGQEGAANAYLACPVAVVAEDEDGKPVKNVKVTFEAPQTGDDAVATAPGARAPTKKSVTVETDGTGHAQCYWWLGATGGAFPGGPILPPGGRDLRAASACRGLRAFLAETPPQGQAAEVRFTARLEKGGAGGPADATDVSYDPGCDYLREQEAETVAEALDALCEALDRPSNLPKVVEVSWPNDRDITAEDFIGGLEVAFDRQMQLPLFSNDTVIVTLEILEDVGERTGAVVSRPLIIHCTFELEGDRKLRLKPMVPNVESFVSSVRKMAGQMKERGLGPGIRVRVRIMGRASFDPKNVLTDGFVPGTPRADKTIALNFDKAGLGEPSDFESWFYIT